MNKLLTIFLLILFIGIGIYEGLPARIANFLQQENVFAELFQKAKQDGSLPGPLRGPFDTGTSQLSTSGVVDWTNKNRADNGLLELRVNNSLQKAAQAKLDDMFKQQYFEHESPDGKHPADVIKAAGYSYLVVGENLALGNYRDDQALVEAWMNSPGHRANILDLKFQEIGVAVGKGMFEGKETWLAVQEFGTPLSACPQPSMNLKREIEGNRSQINAQETELRQTKSLLERSRYTSQSAYEQAVANYNQRVNSLNSLVESTKRLVDTYNAEVGSFNKCLESNG